MARVGLEMGSGSLASALTVIIGPVPVGATWYVTKLDVSNTHADDVDVAFYVDQGGGARRWHSFPLDASGGQAELIADDRALILNAGGVVRASASVAAVVDYNACGVAET